MIKITHTNTYGWDGAVRGMRNPMNSWERSDSKTENGKFKLGDDDLRLAKRLAKAGTDHRKFLRMIHVQADITAPLYWWKQYDTYKVGTVANSCSTMHKIHSKPFDINQFSHDGMSGSGLVELERIIRRLEEIRLYYKTVPSKGARGIAWRELVALLPSCYLQKRTVDLNYEVLLNMYHGRKNHKLDEWHAFCDWCNSELPYFEEFRTETE